jgi:hypothetical protein
MDSKITLSFNQEVIEKTKKFADAHNISSFALNRAYLSKNNQRELQEPGRASYF